MVFVTTAFGFIGLIDDYSKIKQKNSDGMSALTKYFLQSIAAIGVAVYLFLNANSLQETSLLIPFFKDLSIPMGFIGFTVLTYLVVVGSSNAVNLTDGLDGLAIMPAVMIISALGIFAYLGGNIIFLII